MSGRAPAVQRLRPAPLARGKRFAIVASQFHPALVRRLVRGATDTLRRHGASNGRVEVLWTPGAFELPVVAARLARRRPRPDAIIALGALIRGETSQYAVIAHAAAQGLSQVSVTTGIPVTFGVIVASNRAQAAARAGLPAPRPRRGRRSARQAGGARVNRGTEAALAALAVLRLLERT